MLEVSYSCIPNPSATKLYCYSFVRLACLIHAVSVQSEPGSNSQRKKLVKQRFVKQISLKTNLNCFRYKFLTVTLRSHICQMLPFVGYLSRNRFVVFHRQPLKGCLLQTSRAYRNILTYKRKHSAKWLLRHHTNIQVTSSYSYCQVIRPD